MIPNELDKFCNSCKNFDRILKGKAMAGFCLKHSCILDAKTQFERVCAPFWSEDLKKIVGERKIMFELKEDCWVDRND